MELLGHVTSKGASAASSAAAGVAAAVGGVRDRTNSALTRAAQAYEAHHYEELRTYLADFFTDRVDLKALRDAGYGRHGALLRGAKSEALERLVSLSRPIRARVMLALRETIKDAALSDPDMWNCARWRLESVIDLFWDDLTVYVESVVGDAKDQMLKRGADHSALKSLGLRPTCLSFSWFRAKLLYHYLPFDSSIFGQIKDPLFWILTAISVTPMYGIRVAFFALVLLCIVAGAPPDEYQTVCFILMFKGAQFLSSGVFMACLAAFEYYMCVKPGGTHTCDTEGPGVSQGLATSSVDFVGSCALVWLAFLLLPCTRSFAGAREITAQSDVKEEEQSGAEERCCFYDRSRGGRLAGLLGYDLFTFVLSCALIYVLTVLDVSKEATVQLEQVAINKDLLLSDLQNWQFRSRFFFGRIVYGLLSFPFLIFQLPVLNGILTHTNPTGYNPQGLCVPYLLRPMQEAKSQ